VQRYRTQPRGFFQQFVHTSRQRIRRGFRNQESGHAIVDRLRDSTGRVGNHRNASGERFQHYARQPLLLGWNQQQIQIRQHRRNVIAPSEEIHGQTFRHPPDFIEIVQSFRKGRTADDELRGGCRMRDQVRRAQEIGLPFSGSDPSDDSDPAALCGVELSFAKALIRSAI